MIFYVRRGYAKNKNGQTSHHQTNKQITLLLMGARQAHCLRQILSVCIINLVAFYSQIPLFDKKTLSMWKDQKAYFLGS